MTIRGASDTSPPTDMELMLYADGELEADRIAAVQAWLDGDGGARNKLAGLGMVSELVRAQAHETSASADAIADAVMQQITQEITPEVVAPLAAHHQPPANDNARSFYVIAAFVVAAAAAALLWARPPAPTAQLAVTPPAATAPQAPGALEPEGDVEHGVEVASVDFGARMGAVFYVPTGTSASSTTTVVWLSDDSAGENQ